MRRSNSFVLGPVVIQPDLNASAASFISSSLISGGLNGITRFVSFSFIIRSYLPMNKCLCFSLSSG